MVVEHGRRMEQVLENRTRSHEQVMSKMGTRKIRVRFSSSMENDDRMDHRSSSRILYLLEMLELTYIHICRCNEHGI